MKTDAELEQIVDAIRTGYQLRSAAEKERDALRVALEQLKLKLETAKGALNFITRCKDPIESTGYVMQEKAREALSKLNSA